MNFELVLLVACVATNGAHETFRTIGPAMINPDVGIQVSLQFKKNRIKKINVKLFKKKYDRKRSL